MGPFAKLSGFTFIELVFYITILAILAVIFFRRDGSCGGG
ncbi:MAG: type II secretion system protein, partial [Nitrospinota bacterium]